MSKITLLIPFFNEGERILRVLEQMVKISEIDQIICVDDGSTDNMYEKILSNYDVEVIRSTQNQGKSAAIKMGMSRVENELVFLCDADLCQINVEEFRVACHFIKQDMLDRFDMIILRRTKAPWFVKFDRGDILFSGERILKSNDLREVLKREVENYQLEMAINQWMLLHQKNVYWLPSAVTNTYKFQKLGLVKGLMKEFKMWYNLVTYIGVKNYVNHIRKFARRRIESPVNRKNMA
ncbi:glycosyltransferase family 2 protein [Catalinimonas niigatensis]|uniref:glycosyltransferase family 2 protein n=1 Tax=Catalinimonas niigatensis TaxID=1397264 RepID=UPI002665EAF4|nr:glycosyltransferase family 2 protein [Catalinimonas niigatensis]WPP49354.1 glycosyltransferase family 2 protein [Catalinimonas niigatensis]